MAASTPLSAFRGTFLDFIADPFHASWQDSVRFLPDGLLVVENGRIRDFGHYQELGDRYSGIPLTDHTGHLLLPGLIDLHVHYPQLEMIAAYGEQLLGWLNRYTFPTERKFQDYEYGRAIASRFLDLLLQNGTTTALVFATVFPQSVDAFFEEAEQRRLRMIAGKVMMDRNAPDYLTDTAQQSYEDSKRLIQKWHGRGRLRYAVTPRFAVTSTEAQLRLAGKLLQEFPDVYLHTHLSENLDEVALVKSLFPDSEGYLDVYDQAGLVGARSLFAHCIHLTDQEWRRLSQAGSAIATCPTSNLFIGSGLFPIQRAKSTDTPVKLGLGTDVGGGTSLSLLQTMNEAYKVAQLQSQSLSAFQALFLATLGGATALNLQDTIGSFTPGKEADFIALDLQATPVLALRNGAEMGKTLEAIADQVFALLMLGDERSVAATYILGEPAIFVKNS
jgi:guanine deaminase